MTTAGMMFAAYSAWRSLEGACDELLLRASGVEPADVDSWPMEDITYDGYDRSFEFKDVHGDWTPTGGMLEAYWALGFCRCWVCYDNLDGEGVRHAGPGEAYREKYFRSPGTAVLEDGLSEPAVLGAGCGVAAMPVDGRDL